MVLVVPPTTSPPLREKSHIRTDRGESSCFLCSRRTKSWNSQAKGIGMNLKSHLIDHKRKVALGT